MSAKYDVTPSTPKVLSKFILNFSSYHVLRQNDTHRHTHAYTHTHTEPSWQRKWVTVLIYHVITGFSYLLSEPAPVGRVIQPHRQITTVQTTAHKRTYCKLQSNKAMTGSLHCGTRSLRPEGRNWISLCKVCESWSTLSERMLGFVCESTKLFELFLFFTEKYPNHHTNKEDQEGLIKAQLALTKGNAIFLLHLSFFRRQKPLSPTVALNITAALWLIQVCAFWWKAHLSLSLPLCDVSFPPHVTVLREHFLLCFHCQVTSFVGCSIGSNCQMDS